MRIVVLALFLSAVSAPADDPKAPDKKAVEAPAKPDAQGLLKELSKSKRLDRTGQDLLRDRTIVEYEIAQLAADRDKLLSEESVRTACDLLDNATVLAELDRILDMSPANRAKPYAEFLTKHKLDERAIKAADVVIGLQERIGDFRTALRVISARMSEHEKKATPVQPLRLPSVTAPRGVPDAEEVRLRYTKPDSAPASDPKAPDPGSAPALDNIRRKAGPAPPKKP